MIAVFLGDDGTKARKALNAAAEKNGGTIVRLTDTSSVADLESVLAGSGMFAQVRAVILDRLSDNDELWAVVANAFGQLSQSDDSFFLYEEKADAATKRLFQKFATKIETFDLAKKGKERPTVFVMVNHLRAGDKKKLWVAYQEELAQGNAAEAIHGVLFWGAKQMLLQARGAGESDRAKRLVIELTELPHESRRRGEELEYALERFVLSV